MEGQLLRSVSLKLFSWLRFIDDVNMKLTHGPENLEIFLQEVNSFPPTIGFTAEVSNEEHVFLDTKSRLVGNIIDVDLYTKPTDTHHYLLPSSFHPKHCDRVIGPTLKMRYQHTINCHSHLESQVTKKRRLALLQAKARTIRHIDSIRADISSRAT